MKMGSPWSVTLRTPLNTCTLPTPISLSALLAGLLRSQADEGGRESELGVLRLFGKRVAEVLGSSSSTRAACFYLC